jgi:hypothetical protein
MLPPALNFFWQQLLDLLLQMQTAEKQHLQTHLQAAIEVLAGQISPQMKAGEFPAPIAAKMQSYLTECHRLLRLLQTDVMFLQTARSTDTARQRYAVYQQRLESAITFCRAAIDLMDNE